MKSCRTSRCATAFLALAISAAGAPGLAANKKPPLTPVNLNTATALELQQVPGIGPSTADKILKMRKSYGPFKSVDDLRAIKGIGPRRMEKMRKYVTVGKAATPKKSSGGGASQSSSPFAAKPASHASPKTLNQNPRGLQ
jgi:comEA protein